MPQDIPGVVWIAALLLILGSLAYLVYRIRAIGIERYGLAFFFSLPFGSLVLATTAIYAGVLFPILIGFDDAGESALINLRWGGLIFAGSILLAYSINAFRSNAVFAFLYTFLQAVIAISSVLLLGFWFLRGKEKNKRSNSLV